MRAAFIKSLSNPLVQLIAAVSVAVVLGMAIREALAGHLTPGEFMSFIAALAGMTQPLRSLVNIANPLQQGVAAAESLPSSFLLGSKQ